MDKYDIICELLWEYRIDEKGYTIKNLEKFTKEELEKWLNELKEKS